MNSCLLIGRAHINEIIKHVSHHAPLEACGLLAGEKDRVKKIIMIWNQAQSPVRFVMDPYEQIQAFDRIESEGLELLGIFHSHPAGPETASVTDIEEAAYDVVHVICSQADGQWKLRGFHITNGKAKEASLQIVD